MLTIHSTEHIFRRADIICKAHYHKSLTEAAGWQVHNAVAGTIQYEISDEWMQTQRKQESGRRAVYLSAEYLVGRLIGNNLMSLGILDGMRNLLMTKGVDPALMEDIEDAALGNGGLGRLAACFLDSAATLDMPLMGYGLYYQFGLLKQDFNQGRQVELPDNWTEHGDIWSIRRDDLSVIVPMLSASVRAVPYDMPIIGWKSDTIATLRLWKCESLHEIDFAVFNEQHYAKAAVGKNEAEDITKLLYPNDTERAGKLLRLKQQYVLCSASIQDLIRNFKAHHGMNFHLFPQYHAIQLNDTHPTMAIPELIRLLIHEGLTIDQAIQIAKETFSYTNHTVMQEALEKWDISLLRELIPEIAQIISVLQAHLVLEGYYAASNDKNALDIIKNDTVHMANLAMYGSHAVNGVARIHTQILRDEVLKAWHDVRPEMFHSITNGITQRRWLQLCNPELSSLISGRIGDGFITDLEQLEKLVPHIEDEKFVTDFIRIKRKKKQQLSDHIYAKEGVLLPGSWVFDVQVKRMHEYKRQLLNALSIVSIYHGMKNGQYKDLPPVAFIFGAKAAPGYVRAKAVIHYINCLADIINNDPDMAGRMRLVFVRNYNCSYAEKIIPAADISEQISPAGTEASGTGNMKLMLNGAVTLGTFDGANIEIVEQAGLENNYIFGAKVDELNELKSHYRPRDIYDSDPVIRDALDTLVNDPFIRQDEGFRELYQALLDGAAWHQADHYFVLKDFSSYLETKIRAISDTADPHAFARKCLMNVAHAGLFSSDRTVREYADKIWKI